MSELRALVNERKYKRKLVTDTYNRRNEFASLSLIDKSVIKSKLKDCCESLKGLDAKIQALKWSTESEETPIEDEFRVCEEYFDRIRYCLSHLEGIGDVTSEANKLLKCPIAPLPQFRSLENEDLTKFLSQFEEVVSKYNLGDYEKLLLLKQQVSGRALILINSLESHNQGYSQAKELLEKALASPDVQKFNTLKTLSELKLDSCDDPFEYVSMMKSISENFRKLSISTETVLQYFFWAGLNDSFRNTMISITNHTWPTLKEINDNFFVTCERYTHKHKKRVVSTDLAVNITNSVAKPNVKYYPCSLCSHDGEEVDHSVKRCTKYSSPVSKVEKLKRIGACIRCALTNHTTINCKYRFKNMCSECGGYHWSYLCMSSKKNKTGEASNSHNRQAQPQMSVSNSKVTHNTEKKAKTTEKKSGAIGKTDSSQGNTTTIIEVQQSSSESETILPTFTCYVDSKLVRVMKDSGCQTNFISDDLAGKLELPVLDEVNLTVNGINSSKVYHTKMVEVELKCGNKINKVIALCIPSIDINMKLPGLSKVVMGFLSKGYFLADKLLSSSSEDISDIQIILGAKSSYCVPEKEILFGCESRSVYSVTDYGIMLKGDINTLIGDIPHLPYSKAIASVCSTAVIQSSGPVFSSESRKYCLTSNLNLDHSKDSNFEVIDGSNDVLDNQLQKAVREMLDISSDVTNGSSRFSEETVLINDKLIEFAFEKLERKGDGRISLPILWNSRVSHLLGKNLNISRQILKSLLRKAEMKTDGYLEEIDKVFKDQLNQGIIEKIVDLKQFTDHHPEYSFLPFMPILKPERDTTKCRVVFLSNLSEKGTMNHNQTIFAGPPLNQKLSSSILHLRFGQKICCFDIKKAFNQIELHESDQTRLLFLWFNDISRQDYSFVAYKNVRLPFGLRCSPTLLMLAMYHMLVKDCEMDSIPVRNLKRLIYQLAYMDNCAISAESSADLAWMYDKLRDVFQPYCFELQQFTSNDQDLQTHIDNNQGSETPTITKLLGLYWNRLDDKLTTKPIQLDITADTKRTVLSTIASQFDILNFNGPLMNRARLFLHKLQCQQELQWDQSLSPDQQHEWRNIVKQANSAPPIEINRNFGARHHRYKLLAYADSSKVLYGIVVYLWNLDTDVVSFVLARNKIVNKQLEAKSIPSLELLALTLATETIDDLKKELSSPVCVDPINIEECEIFSDSFVALSWLNSYALKLDKMQKRNAFVLNRLEDICKFCESSAIKFSFVSGEHNPADCITRPLSYRQLIKTNYFSGPLHLNDARPNEMNSEEFLSFVVPGPSMNDINIGVDAHYSNIASEGNPEHLFSFSRFSSFQKVVRIHALVLSFINRLKVKLKIKNPDKFAGLDTVDDGFNFFQEASKQIIQKDQLIHFSEIFHYFESKEKTLKMLPNLVGQLNLYVDQQGLLRVKSKCEKMRNVKRLQRYSFPLLISKKSVLCNMIINDYHLQLSHAGCYSVIAEIRRSFWIPHIYSLVKRQLRICVDCKRMNARPIKLNQSPYREFRMDPVNVPFSQVYMDYMGPFLVKGEQGENTKVWLACFTCMWSRAINLKVCLDLSTDEFLRAFQLHCYDYGVPTHCVSDMGSQLVAGSNCIRAFLNDQEISSYLQANCIDSVKFEQYYKGHSELGSLVESCVKLVKRLLYGSIRNYKLILRDFEFIIAKTIHLVNRRPVAFKDSLRDTTGDEIPEIITPEMLIHGRDLFSFNVIPYLQSSPDPDIDWSSDPIPSTFEKLQKVRSKLITLYNEEFIGKLIYQAVNKADRYKPVKHNDVNVGDIVLLKEPLSKPHNYPLARVKDIVRNSNDEITGVTVIKGKSKEIVKRHSSCIIPLLSADTAEADADCDEEISQMEEVQHKGAKPKRKTALDCITRNKQIFQNE